MATLADFRTRVSRKLGLTNEAGHDELAAIDSWCNEAVDQILLKTGCYVTTTTLALSANTKDYQLATGILDIQRVIDADNVPLEEVAPDEIFDLRRAASTTSSTVGLRYAVDGANLFMVYPTPSAAATLTLYYVPRPTVMSAATHDPSSVSPTNYGGIPTEFHKLIELYALAEGSDYDDDQTAEQGQRYRALFDRGIAEMRRHLSLKGSRKLPRARIGGTRRRPIASDPSADWYG